MDRRYFGVEGREDTEFTEHALALIEKPKLNLGCGAFPKVDFLNFDARQDLERVFLGRIDKHGDPWIIVNRYPDENGDFQPITWDWQKGLFWLEDESVYAITESHSLMYLTVEEYPAALSECYRVLKKGGIMRVTQDNCDLPPELLEEYRLPWGNPASVTDAKMMRTEMERVGFEVYDVGENETHYEDDSLIQHFHGEPPRVFHMEGIKR